MIMNDIILANLGYGYPTQARLRNIPSEGYDCLRWKKPSKATFSLGGKAVDPDPRSFSLLDPNPHLI